jgi:molybdopterin-guanine dinucleotide biosynthesis protein A
MDAVITAGGIPLPDEPLYSYSMGESKALIDVAGKPMIQWVLDALNEAKTIDRVVIVGLADKAGLSSRKPLAYLSNEGKLLENLKAGTAKVLELNPKAKYVLFVSSDIPGITGPMVDWVVKTCLETKDDLYYNVIRRESMEARFPTSKRTYTRLKDLELCGGDMNMARAAIVQENSEFWDSLLERRKNPVAQATLIGWDIVAKFLVRQLTIDDVIQRVANRLGIKGRPIICPFPEVGMDVDKPHQLEIMRAYLARQARSRSAGVRTAASKASGRRKASGQRKAARASKPSVRRVAAKSRSKKAAPRSRAPSRKK